VIDMGDDAQVARAFAGNRFENIGGDVAKADLRRAAEMSLKRFRTASRHGA
jgi:hypothetical protein